MKDFGYRKKQKSEISTEANDKRIRKADRQDEERVKERNCFSPLRKTGWNLQLQPFSHEYR